jgi:hypothetical protein
MGGLVEYIHIKNLEKYHPGYADRNLIWAKTYFTIVEGDPEFELISSEIDKWRYVAMVCLELKTKKPLPLKDEYFRRKGFDLKKRSMSKTLQMLHNFVERVTEDGTHPYPRVEVDIELDIEKEEECRYVTEAMDYFNHATNQRLHLTEIRKSILRTHYNNKVKIEDLKVAIDNFAKDDWAERDRFKDLVYCLGNRNKVNNFEKWFKHEQQPAGLPGPSL